MNIFTKDIPIRLSTLILGAFLFCSQSCTTGNSNDNYVPDSVNVNSVDKPIVQSAQDQIIKTHYNIYIENSASMDGYVGSKDITFQQAVYGLITAVNLADLVDTPKLNFVNRSIIPAVNNPITADLNEYADKLNISTFRAHRKPNQNTDIADIISLVFQNSKNDVNIIISDFIYSRGGGQASIGKEAIQQNAIANIVKSFLDKKDYDILFMQFFAQFQGVYYSESVPEKKPVINSTRPYYMMVIGPHDAVRQFLEKTNRLEKFKQNGFKQMCYFHKPDPNKHAKITLIDKIGNYEFDNAANSLVINNAEKNEDDIGQKGFQFSVAVDYSNIVEDPDYFLQKGNYSPINNYSVSIEQIKDTTQLSTKGYTHLLKLQTNNLINPTEILQITLNKKIPDWVNKSSSDDDSYIQNADQKNKTFGLKYVIEGIDQAFAAKYKTALFSVSVKVNKAPGGSSNGLLIFFLLLLLAGVVIFFVKKIKQA